MIRSIKRSHLDKKGEVHQTLPLMINPAKVLKKIILEKVIKISIEIKRGSILPKVHKIVILVKVMIVGRRDIRQNIIKKNQGEEVITETEKGEAKVGVGARITIEKIRRIMTMRKILITIGSEYTNQEFLTQKLN